MGHRNGMRVGAITLAIASFGLAAGCSSSASTGSTTTSTAPGTGSGAGRSSQLTRMEARLTDGKSLTYKATYSLTTPSQHGTFVVERMPPGNTRFDVSTSGQQLAIISGTTGTYICDLTQSPTTCASGIPDPVTSLEKLVDPAEIIPNLQQAAAHGVANVSFSSRTVSGMPSTCATITAPSAGTFCVTDQGLLASVSASNGSITLTDFTTEVPVSDFAPPAGATVQSLP